MFEFSVKDPASVATIEFDFTDQLDGASITGTPTVTVSMVFGTDASANAIKSGAASVSGNSVLQVIQNGIHGRDYLLRCDAIASNGAALVLCGILPVRTYGL